MHSPPFKHGLEAHSSAQMSTLPLPPSSSEANGSGHAHVNLPTMPGVFVHTPPLRHGLFPVVEHEVGVT